MNTPEVAFVLACVREASPATSPDVAETAARVRDWTEVLRLAGRNRVTAFLLRAVREQAASIPAAAVRSLSDSAAEGTARTMLVDVDLDRAVMALDGASIRLIALKGPGLARTIYPEPSLRPYDDIDLCIEGTDLDHVVAALTRGGFTQISRPKWSSANTRDFVASTTRTLLEVHGDLLQTGLAPKCDADRWRRASAIPGLAGVEMLAPEDQLVHLSYHAHKHGFNRLIWLKDIDLLIRNTPGLDWDVVQSVSTHEELRSSLWLALDFARTILGTPVPPPLLQSLRPTTATRVLYRLAWPPRKLHALKGHMRRRAVQFDSSESWRGMISSAVFMGRRLERVRLFAEQTRTGSSKSHEVVDSARELGFDK